MRVFSGFLGLLTVKYTEYLDLKMSHWALGTFISFLDQAHNQ